MELLGAERRAGEHDGIQSYPIRILSVLLSS